MELGAMVMNASMMFEQSPRTLGGDKWQLVVHAS
jgi:hypothetical protein